MGPRIEYENPLAVVRSDKVAAGDKVRRENRKRRSSADQKKSGEPCGEEEADEAAQTVEPDAPQDLGKRIDFEA
jgi:hypothetical protein